MKVIVITLMLLFSRSIFAHETSPITLEWKKSIENYQIYIVLKDYQKAIAEAEKLLNIEPSSNEAIFYIRYAYNKSSLKMPAWVRSEINFTELPEGQFYQLLASELDETN
ncbi:MAG: hypothetical protein V7765_07375 [Oleispira sp.]